MGRWKKPKWLKKAQTAASNVVKPITTSAPIKNIQRAAQSAANTVKREVINPVTTSKPIKQIQRAAQNTANTVAKEVGHVVNPVAGEIAMRAKDLANSKAVKQAGDAIGDGLRSFDKNVIQPVSTSKTMKTIQGKAQQAADYVGDEVRNIPGSLKNMAQASQDPEKKGSFLPFFTKIIPDAAGDVVGGLGRTAAGLITADGDKMASGLKRMGSGTWDAVKHTGLGTLEVAGRMLGQGPSGSYTQGAGKGGTRAQREREEIQNNKGVVPKTPEEQETLDKLQKYGEDAWDAFKDIMKAVYDEGIKPGFDNPDVKSKRMRYGDVASDAEIEAYRRADKRTKDIIEAQWQYRQQFPGRDYAEDFMSGRQYQP